jgi:hypothetical protein
MGKDDDPMDIQWQLRLAEKSPRGGTPSRPERSEGAKPAEKSDTGRDDQLMRMADTWQEKGVRGNGAQRQFPRVAARRQSEPADPPLPPIPRKPAPHGTPAVRRPG